MSAQPVPEFEFGQRIAGEEQLFLALGALVRLARRGGGFQRGLEKFLPLPLPLPLRVRVRRNSDFLLDSTIKIGIDRSAAVMDAWRCAVEFPILQQFKYRRAQRGVGVDVLQATQYLRDVVALSGIEGYLGDIYFADAHLPMLDDAHGFFLPLNMTIYRTIFSVFQSEKFHLFLRGWRLFF